MPETIHLTPICFRPWCEETSREALGNQKVPLWPPESGSQGREEVAQVAKAALVPTSCLLSSVHLPLRYTYGP